MPQPPARFPLVLGPDGRPALGTWGEGSKVRAAVTDPMQTRAARALAASKLTLDAALGQVAIAAAMVMAGTGDLATLQVGGAGAGGRAENGCGVRWVWRRDVCVTPRHCPHSSCVTRRGAATATCTLASRLCSRLRRACSSSPEATRR